MPNKNDLTPTQILMNKVVAAVEEWEAAQGPMDYSDLNLVLNTAWEVISAIPPVKDKDLDSRITKVTQNLDDLTLETMNLSEELGDETPAAPQGRSRRSGSVQKNFRDLVAAALPEAAQDKSLEIWFQTKQGSGSRAR